jgi:hypothetical protein
MPKALGKLGFSVLLLTVALLTGTPKPAYACPWESHGCQEPDIECCCDRGVICAWSYQACVDFCG